MVNVIRERFVEGADAPRVTLKGYELLLDPQRFVEIVIQEKLLLSDFQQKALKANNQKETAIVAGIRPQHITVGEGELEATVEVSEMLGSEYNLHTRSGDDEVVMVIPTVDLTTDVSMGSTIRFTAKPDLIQLFDEETGNNLIWYDETSASADAPVCRNYGY